MSAEIRVTTLALGPRAPADGTAPSHETHRAWVEKMDRFRRVKLETLMGGPADGQQMLRVPQYAKNVVLAALALISPARPK